MRSSTSKAATSTCSTSASKQARQLDDRRGGRFSVGAPAVQEGRRAWCAAPRCRRPACAPRSRPRRDLHRAGREGPAAQPHAVIRRRTIAIRYGRPTAADIAWLSDESGEYQLMIAEQTGVTKPRTIALAVEGVLLRARSGRPTASSCCSRTTTSRCGRSTSPAAQATKLDTDTYDDPGRALRRGVVARLAVDRVLEEPRQPPARDLPLLDRRRSARTRSPTACRMPSRRPSTRRASISTSSPAPTTRCVSAGSR